MLTLKSLPPATSERSQLIELARHLRTMPMTGEALLDAAHQVAELQIAVDRINRNQGTRVLRVWHALRQNPISDQKIRDAAGELDAVAGIIGALTAPRSGDAA